MFASDYEDHNLSTSHKGAKLVQDLCRWMNDQELFAELDCEPGEGCTNPITRVLCQSLALWKGLLYVAADRARGRLSIPHVSTSSACAAAVDNLAARYSRRVVQGPESGNPPPGTQVRGGGGSEAGCGFSDHAAPPYVRQGPPG